MANSAESLARELADVRRRLAALERGTQLQSSTLGTSAGVVSVVHGLEAGISAGAAAAEALQKAVTAQATADGAVHTYFGDTEPGNASFGDLWRTTDGTVKQYDGEDWQDIADPQVAADVEEALDRVAHAEEALDGKITTYFNNSTNPPQDDPDVILNNGDLWIVADGGNLIRRWDGANWIDAPAGSAALADRAVTSTKLETDLVLTSRVIAGEATGRRAEMNPDGFTVYAPGEDGGTRVVARLGYTSTSDYLAVSNTQGIAGASMSADGTVSGARFNAADIALDGRRLTDVFDDHGRGIVARGVRTTHATYIAPGTVRPYLRVDAVLFPGRQYCIWTSPMVVVNSTNLGTAVAYLGYKIGEEATTSNYTVIQAVRAPGDWTQVQFREPFSLPSGYTTPQTVSFLIAQESITRDGGLYCETNRPGHIVVEDIGRATASSGIATLNASTDRSPLQPARTLTATSVTTAYYGKPPAGSDLYNVVSTPGQNVGDQYQYGFVGAVQGREYRTLVWFPDLTTTLTGRTILSARFKAYVSYWAPSGTTSDLLALGIHSYADYTVAPGTSGHIGQMPPNYTEIVADSVPSGADKWIDLPSSTWDGWKTGQSRGIVLQRPLTRNDDDEYYCQPRGPFTLEINYV